MPYIAHPSAGTLPPDDTVIWRFMSLAKFLSLLTRKSLYFCQARTLRKADPYEGTWSRPNLIFYEAMISNPEFFRQAYNIPSGDALPTNLQDSFSPATQKRIGDIVASITYVNCWNMSEHESAFLWSIYAPSEGLAIRSTIGKLRDVLKNEARDIFIGAVAYIDYNFEAIPGGNLINQFFRKRKSFEAEQELRACFWGIENGIGLSDSALTLNSAGHYVPCDIGALADQVCISPAAPQWYQDAVTVVALKFGVEVPIRKSSLSDPAIF